MLITVAAALCGWACNSKPKSPPPVLEPATAPASAPTSQPVGASRHAGAGRLYDRANGFSLIPSADYTTKVPAVGGFLTLVGPRDFGFPVTVTVSTRSGEGKTMDQIADSLKAELRKNNRNYALLNDGTTIIDGKKACFLVSKFTQGATNLQSIQYCVRGENGKLYLLTCAAHARAFNQHRQKFESLAASILAD